MNPTINEQITDWKSLLKNKNKSCEVVNNLIRGYNDLEKRLLKIEVEVVKMKREFFS